MWLLMLKAALLAFIACGVAVIVAVYIRRSRKVRFRQEPDPYLGTMSRMGVVPPTPLPEWAYWNETEEEPKGPDETTPTAPSSRQSWIDPG